MCLHTTENFVCHSTVPVDVRRQDYSFIVPQSNDRISTVLFCHFTTSDDVRQVLLRLRRQMNHRRSLKSGRCAFEAFRWSFELKQY